MAKIEAVLGREDGSHRLAVQACGKMFAVGVPQGVPNSVSRQHCALTVEFSETKERVVQKILVRNLKPQNTTSVDGMDVEIKAIDEKNLLRLGFEGYTVPLDEVLGGLRKLLPVVKETIDIRPLKEVWEWYESTKLDMQLREQKKNNIRQLASLLSMTGMLFMFFEGLGWVRFMLLGVSVLMSLGFFLLGLSSKSSLTVKLHRLDKDFQKKYVCPACGHFMGYSPYNVLSQNPGCPYCKGKYHPK